MNQIRIGIVGYGNLGKGVELAIRSNPDTTLAFVATRRDPSSVKLKTENVPVYAYDDLANHKDDADVVIICGGSATDLPKQTPHLASIFNNLIKKITIHHICLVFMRDITMNTSFVTSIRNLYMNTSEKFIRFKYIFYTVF